MDIFFSQLKYQHIQQIKTYSGDSFFSTYNGLVGIPTVTIKSMYAFRWIVVNVSVSKYVNIGSIYCNTVIYHTVIDFFCHVCRPCISH